MIICEKFNCDKEIILQMGIEIDLAILKEGEEVNKHLLCGICFMILEDPIQCVITVLY
jgi:hypothetical protein